MKHGDVNINESVAACLYLEVRMSSTFDLDFENVSV